MIRTGCILGRAPCTKETLPDFHEWCRVTRHPRIFRGLTGCQRTLEIWGVTAYLVYWLCFGLGLVDCNPQLKNICIKEILGF